MIRILLANPDEKLSRLYSQHIQNHFSVDSAQDGLAALRRLKLHRHSLIVSEYHLPTLSGIALLKFVRSTPEFITTPFIFLSRHTDNTQALSEGANDWLDLESSHPDTLLDKIYRHLRLNKHAIQIH